MSRGHAPTFRRVKQDKTTAARVGVLRVNGFVVETPILWLGHDFDGGSVRLWNEDGLDVPGLLLNACQILEKPLVANMIRKNGARGYLGYAGPIMMDSGGFLFQMRTKMTVRPQTISDLVAASGTDIGVVLDHPLNPSLEARQNGRRWVRTLRNTEEMASAVDSCAFMPVVHGYSLTALQRACRDIRRVLGNWPFIGLGSLVPLVKGSNLGGMFRYRRRNGDKGNHVSFVADAIALVRDQFPAAFLHVFGVGGTTTILSLFALGVDSVDSVAWRLKAAYGAIQLPGVSDRFLTPRPQSKRSRRIVDGSENRLLKACRCPVCSSYTTLGWQKRRLDQSFNARCIHNGAVFLREVAQFRAAVVDGGGRDFLLDRVSKTHRFHGLLSADC